MDRSSQPNPTSEEALKADALALGFVDVGIARADAAWAAGDRLEEFVTQDRHGEMTWMKEQLARRRHPTAMWPAARSAVVVAASYAPRDNPLPQLERREEGVISVYARNADYHDVMKGRLKRLASGFAARSGADVKVFVDTAPLMEKPLAQLAGLGWQGKHTNLVSRAHGSWLFLGVMLTDAELSADAPGADHCGSCRACLDICPTNAFPAPYQLDARRCIAYLTIELAGPIPRELRSAIGNRIYGCDDCLAVCPWNKFAAASREAAFYPRPELTAALLADLVQLDDASFREIFSRSPIKRIGRDRFVRNVLIAIGNSGERLLASACTDRLEDRSPLVRGAAVWALERLDRARFEDERSRRRNAEQDVNVRGEWDGDGDA